MWKLNPGHLFLTCKLKKKLIYLHVCEVIYTYIYKNKANNKDIIWKHKPHEILMFSVETLISQKIIL